MAKRVCHDVEQEETEGTEGGKLDDQVDKAVGRIGNPSYKTQQHSTVRMSTIRQSIILCCLCFLLFKAQWEHLPLPTRVPLQYPLCQIASTGQGNEPCRPQASSRTSSSGSRTISIHRSDKRYIEKVPIATIDLSRPLDRTRHDRMVQLVERMLTPHERLASVRTEHERTLLLRHIAAIDRQIDQLVYELYGLTDEEIRIVEEATLEEPSGTS